jgi:lysosomal alpha-mannosidase
LRKKRAPNHEMKGKSFTLILDETTGQIDSIKLQNGKSYPLKQTFMYYKSSAGVNHTEDSGSYNFCPNGDAVNIGPISLISKYDNGMIHEITQKFSNWAEQTIRVYEDEEYVEFDWIVEPLSIGDGVGKEVITRFETNLKNNKVFYTDANGRQTVLHYLFINYRTLVYFIFKLIL